MSRKHEPKYKFIHNDTLRDVPHNLEWLYLMENNSYGVRVLDRYDDYYGLVPLKGEGKLIPY